MQVYTKQATVSRQEMFNKGGRRVSFVFKNDGDDVFYPRLVRASCFFDVLLKKSAFRLSRIKLSKSFRWRGEARLATCRMCST